MRGHAAFSRVFASGRRFDGPRIRCYIRLEPSDHSELQTGYAVSSRTFNAVRRNRLRRLMRAGFAAQRQPLLEALGRAGKSGAMVLFFRGVPGEDVRRLNVHPISVEITRLCRHVVEKL